MVFRQYLYNKLQCTTIKTISVLVIKKSTPPAHSSTFVITRMIADRIGLHSVLFPLQTTDTQIVHGHRQTTKKLYVSFPFYPPKYKATIHM